MATYSNGIKILNSLSKSCNKSYVATVYTNRLQFRSCVEINEGKPYQYKQEIYKNKSLCHHFTGSSTVGSKCSIESSSYFNDSIVQSLQYSFPCNEYNERTCSQVSTKISTLTKHSNPIFFNNSVDVLICKKSQSSSAIANCIPENKLENNCEILHPSRNSISCEVLSVNSGLVKILEDKKKPASVKSEHILQTSKGNTCILQNDSLFNTDTYPERKLFSKVSKESEQFPNKSTIQDPLFDQLSVNKIKSLKSFTNFPPLLHNIRCIQINKARNYSRVIQTGKNTENVTTVKSKHNRLSINIQSPSNRWVRGRKYLTIQEIKRCIKQKNDACNFNKPFQETYKDIESTINRNTPQHLTPLVNTVTRSKSILKEINSLTKTDVKSKNPQRKVAKQDSQLEVQNKINETKSTVVIDNSTNKEDHGELCPKKEIISHSVQSSGPQHYETFTKNTLQNDLPNKNTKLATEHVDQTVSIEIKTEQDAKSIAKDSLNTTDVFKKPQPNTTEDLIIKNSLTPSEQNKNFSSVLTGNDNVEISKVRKNYSTEKPVNSIEANVNKYPKMPFNTTYTDIFEKNFNSPKQPKHIKQKPNTVKHYLDISNKRKVSSFIPGTKTEKCHINVLTKSNLPKNNPTKQNSVIKTPVLTESLLKSHKGGSTEFIPAKIPYIKTFKNRNPINENKHEFKSVSKNKQNKIKQLSKSSCVLYNSKTQKSRAPTLKTLSKTQIQNKNILPLSDRKKQDQRGLEKGVFATSLLNTPKVSKNVHRNKLKTEKYENIKQTDPVIMLKHLVKNNLDDYNNNNKYNDMPKESNDLNTNEQAISEDIKDSVTGNELPIKDVNIDTLKLIMSDAKNEYGSYNKYRENIKMKLTKKKSLTNINALDGSQYTDKSKTFKSYMNYFVREYNQSLSLRGKMNENVSEPTINDYSKVYSFTSRKPVNQLEPSYFTTHLKNGEVGKVNSHILNHFEKKRLEADKIVKVKEADIFGRLIEDNYLNKPDYKNSLNVDLQNKKRYYEKYSQKTNTIENISSGSKDIKPNFIKDDHFKDKNVSDYTNPNTNKSKFKQDFPTITKPEHSSTYSINVTNIDLNLPHLPRTHLYEDSGL